MTPDTVKNKQTFDISGIRPHFISKKHHPSVPKVSVDIETQGDRTCKTAREKQTVRAQTDLSLSNFDG
jgi:hypothetical protein